MIKILKNIYGQYSIQLMLALCAIPVGIVVGFVDVIFGKVLLEITDIRDAHPWHFIPFLGLAGSLIVFLYRKYGGKSIGGMNLVFQVGHGEEETIPTRMIPFVISGTWLTHLFGGSAGREGVAVQIGATVSHCVGRKIPIENSSEIFLVTGIAAGFAGLFGTPLAAVLFAMEVLTAGELKYQALFPAVTGAFSAAATSSALGLERFTFHIVEDINYSGIIIVKLVICGMIFGIVGGCFAVALKKTKDVMAKQIVNPFIRIAVFGAILSVLFLILDNGRYCGLGTNIIDEALNGEYIYSWDWLIKGALTIMTLAVGFQGGEVTPLFSIGASLGAVCGTLLGFDTIYVAALGYAAVFGSATNTFFAPVLIGAEVFGYEHIPAFFIVCATAYTFNMNKSIYTLQKKKRQK